jgi:hypothetical protein
VKVAFVKQIFDTHGSWSSFRWQETTPLSIFEVWPGRALFWWMTVLLKSDWYVVPQQIYTEYSFDAGFGYPGQKEVVAKYTKDIVPLDEIPVENYDLIITLDPILRVSKRVPTLFAYYVVEHWDIFYYRSLHKVMRGYDLFLAHMLDAPADLSTLPQAVAFPYLWELDTVRTLFKREKEASVWVDWRTLTILGGSGRGSSGAAEKAANRLQEYLGLPVRYRLFKEGLYRTADPPLWGDAKRYFSELAGCRYFVSGGRASGAGQGLVDAASVGAIVFGEQDKPYHCLLCHPACLCADMAELPHRFRRVVASPALQHEIIEWQDAKLKKHFINDPLTLLQRAIDMKRSHSKGSV